MGAFSDSDYGFTTFLQALSAEAALQPRADADDERWILYFLGIAAEAVLAQQCSFQLRSVLFSGMLGVRDSVQNSEIASALAADVRSKADRLLEFRNWLRSGCSSSSSTDWEAFYRQMIVLWIKKAEKFRKAREQSRSV